ncbi:hypothetical protein BU672_11155 [Staphylococcus chromogenes]|nr:hypothetical protein BU672_11155 [Staphylococcus chromogenes]
MIYTYIANTVQIPHLISGPIEGINNKIKLITHVTYGYRNFNNFRNRIFIISRLYVSKYKNVLSNKNLPLSTFYFHQPTLTKRFYLLFCFFNAH